MSEHIEERNGRFHAIADGIDVSGPMPTRSEAGRYLYSWGLQAPVVKNSGYPGMTTEP